MSQEGGVFWRRKRTELEIVEKELILRKKQFLEAVSHLQFIMAKVNDLLLKYQTQAEALKGERIKSTMEMVASSMTLLDAMEKQLENPHHLNVLRKLIYDMMNGGPFKGTYASPPVAVANPVAHAQGSH